MRTQSTVGASGTGYLGQFSAQQPGKTVNAQQFSLASGLAFRVRAMHGRVLQTQGLGEP